MRSLTLFAATLLAGCASSSLQPSNDNTVVGPVVEGKKSGSTDLQYLPFSNTAGAPVITTEAFVKGYALPLAGGIVNGAFTVTRTNADYKTWLAKYVSGTGHTDAPKALNAEAAYLQVGGREYGAGTYRGIGFGYVSGRSDIPPAFITYQEVGTAGNTNGNICLATRSTTSNVAPTPNFCVMTDGQIQGSASYVPKQPYALTNKSYVDAQSLSPAAITAIKALTSSSTIADVISALQKQ